MNNKLIYIILFFILGCAQMTSVGLQKHQFGSQPTKIIWFQIAGLSEEHLALLKYSLNSTEQQLEFENFICLGKMWNYSLYQLRSNPQIELRSQESGTKDVSNTCEDFNKNPIWRNLAKVGYKTAIFESAGSKNSSILTSPKDCPANQEYYKGVTEFISSPEQLAPKDGLKFHASEQDSFKDGQVYFDRSCDSKGCFSSLSDNIFSTYKRFINNKQYYLYIVKDYSFYEAMNRKQFKTAKRILLELNGTIKLIKDQANLADTLILLTSSSPIALEFPLEGTQWKAFEQNDKFANIKNAQLMSLSLATGARAENFCGIYEQSEVLNRLQSTPKSQGLEFIFLNPFE